MGWPARGIATCLAVVAAHGELEHLVEGADAGEQPAEAPEGAAAQAAAAHALAGRLAVDLQDADPGADVHQQVRVQVAVGCDSVDVLRRVVSGHSLPRGNWFSRPWSVRDLSFRVLSSKDPL